MVSLGHNEAGTNILQFQPLLTSYIVEIFSSLFYVIPWHQKTLAGNISNNIDENLFNIMSCLTFH